MGHEVNDYRDATQPLTKSVLQAKINDTASDQSIVCENKACGLVNRQVTVLEISIPTSIIPSDQAQSHQGSCSSSTRLGLYSPIETDNSPKVILVALNDLSQQTTRIANEINGDSNNDNRCEQDRLGKQLTKVAQLNILTDNQKAVKNIQRKTAASSLVQTTRKILKDAQKMGIVVNANHIKGIDNRKADALSRLELIGDFEIRIKYMNIVLQSQDLKLDADMFATKYNKKCPIYYAPTSDEEAAGVGDLQADWNNKTFLIKPPLTLVWRIVRKLLTVKNCIAIIIAKDWVNQ
ncbi:MAG: hypothetical protein EZS28_042783 [Streblomastix strix]|uniref:RNase H type-1 domain-containing protein n=1 Tax=Streblomastix strix TaxID=222440 RepID=A0A5J4TUK2_9EUKA|nr:MAG: hypothetical protein EZS28_042783 [Streblomastix strix]